MTREARLTAVAEMVARGETNRAIALALGVHRATVARDKIDLGLATASLGPCLGCGKPKPSGKQRWCSPECVRAAAVERNLKTRYDITGERYQQLFDMQDGRCAICLRKPRKQKLAVDHDHGTGEVRGLLCMWCNHKLLGGARDNIDILRRAVRYLAEPPARMEIDGD